MGTRKWNCLINESNKTFPYLRDPILFIDKSQKPATNVSHAGCRPITFNMLIHTFPFLGKVTFETDLPQPYHDNLYQLFQPPQKKSISFSHHSSAPSFSSPQTAAAPVEVSAALANSSAARKRSCLRDSSVAASLAAKSSAASASASREISRVARWCFHPQKTWISSWWLNQPSWKIWVKLDHFPK